MYFAYSTTSKKKETRISYDATSKWFVLKTRQYGSEFLTKLITLKLLDSSSVQNKMRMMTTDLQINKRNNYLYP